MKWLAIPCLLLFMTTGGNAQNERARTDSLMSSIYQSGYPGAAIAVIKDGGVVFKKGYGVADLDSKAPITPVDKLQHLFDDQAVHRLRDSAAAT